MRGELFGNTATAYRFDGENWNRTLLRGVALKIQREQTTGSDGTQRFAAKMRVRIPAAGLEECPVREGDVLIEGEGPLIGTEYTMEMLREEEESCCAAVCVADNTGRARLKHWRIDAR